MYFEGFESTLHAAHGLVAPPIPIDENLSKMLSDVLRVRIMLVIRNILGIGRSNVIANTYATPDIESCVDLLPSS